MNKQLPKFKNEEEEAVFWETHDATDYFDESDHVEVDFSEARAARKKRLRPPVVSRKPRLRKAAG